MSQTQSSTKPRYFKRSKNKIDQELLTEKLQKKGKLKTQKQRKNRNSATSPVGEVISENPKFPNKSRFIPEKPVEKPKKRKPQLHLPRLLVIPLPKTNTQVVLLSILISAGIIWNMWLGFVFVKTFIFWSQVVIERQRLTGEMALWEDIAKQYPNYRDAYVKGAVYAYQLGNREKEVYFLDKLQLLDPNFSLTKTYQQLLNLQQSENQ